ncbi:MAG: PDZ domain-containing protein [Planctomycetes bacterium]|nr:PDZ domain-containing protein [Planctomycetota bacterium]
MTRSRMAGLLVFAMFSGGCVAAGGAPDMGLLAREAVARLDAHLVYVEVVAEIRTPMGASVQTVRCAGIPLTSDGLILLPLHVAQDSVQGIVVWAGRREYRGKIAAQDEQGQLTLLRIRPAESLSPLAIPDPARSPAVGEWVLSLSPTGPANDYRRFPAAGWVRGQVADQFDSLLVQGIDGQNLLVGCPVIDRRGNWVACLQQRRVTLLRDLRPKIQALLRQVAEGQTQEERQRQGDPWLGLYHQPINVDYADGAGLPRSAVWLTNVISDGPAGKAGLRTGDLVVSVDGTPLALEGAAAGSYMMKLLAPEVGRSALVGYRRAGQAGEVTVAFEARPKLREYRATDLGIQVVEVSEVEVVQRNLQRRTGVVVTEVVPGSAATATGTEGAQVRANDVIVGVNRRPIAGLYDFTAAIDEIRRSGTQTILLEVWNGNTSRYGCIDLRLGRRDGGGE